MTSRRRSSFALAVVTTAAVFMAACSGGGDDSTSGGPSLGTDPVASAAAGSSDTGAPVDTGTIVDEGGLTTDPAASAPEVPPSTVPPAEELPVLSFTSLTAGPIEVTASQCTIEGIPNAAADAAVESFALDATSAYVPTSDGVAVLTFTPGESCSMVLDRSLPTAERVDSLAVSATGRLVASGIFGATVFDLALDRSYECDQVSGDVDITADGASVMTSFPGSPVEQFVLSDTSCSEPTEVTLPADITDVYYVAHAPGGDGTDLFVGGESLDGSIVGGRMVAGALQWRIGNAEVGGPGWIGWVHGIAPCSTGVCLLDTNTDKLVVTDSVGVLRAEFSVSELIGARLFYESMEVGPDGALYVLATDSAADGAGGTIERNSVIRIEVTG